MAIIALSGVPPLSGFGGKWLLFTGLLEKGWYFQLALAFFSSTIAFLYCFRLIHTVFLGQEKAEFKEIRKAPLWLLLPQFILIGCIMAISMMPHLILKPIIAAVSDWYPSTLRWSGSTLISGLGYWNGFLVMNVVMVMFGLLFVWMLFVLRKPQKVKQFNIVFAAERPYLPETTHYAYNFFSHYQKAFGFLVVPRAQAFWDSAGEWSRTLSSAIGSLYTGNGQTYVLHIVLYVVVLYFMAAGV
jgi:NADH:ubiquinone oxidoreductase subunit 5 (subunit L)/multisubunit Na+/H+ antiporter MnhA subunit